MAADNPLQTLDADSFVRELQAKVLESSDRVIDSVTSDVERHIAARAFPPTDPTALRSWLQRASGLLVRSLWADDHIADGQTWRALGAQRCDQGDEEDAVFDDLGDVAAVVWQSILDCAGTFDTAGPVALAATAGLRRNFEHTVTQARLEIRSGHRTAAANDRATSERPPSRFIDRLLSGVFGSDEDARRAAGRIGYSLADPHLLLVAFNHAGGTGDLKASAQPMAEAIGAISGSIRSEPRCHSTALAPCPSPEAFESAVRRADKVAADHGLVAVVLGPIDQPIRFAAEYQGLLCDSAVLDMTTSVPAAVSGSDFNHHRLLSRAAIEERLAFVTMVLDRLLADPRAIKLLTTLHAHFETPDGHEGVARRLGVTVRTVGARLRTIDGLLRDSLKRPREATRVFTATRLALTLKAELAQARPEYKHLEAWRAWT
jgi:hypothetical protein